MSIIETLKKRISGDTKATASVAGNAAVAASHKTETGHFAKNLTDEEKKTLSSIVKKLRITEKSAGLQKGNVYTFNVRLQATKRQIKSAVEKLYEVNALDVHTVNIPRKKRMRGRMEGWKQGYRKAMVRIKDGQTIELQ